MPAKLAKKQALGSYFFIKKTERGGAKCSFGIKKRPFRHKYHTLAGCNLFVFN
jgi:hypothetical protein